MTILFWIFLFSAVTLIAVHGHELGKSAAFAIMAATVTTLTLHLLMGVENSQPLVFLTDLTLLTFVGFIAVRCDRYWPLWFAGFHSISVATSLANLAFPIVVPEIYIDKSGFWALPALGAAVVGILLDRRAELKSR